MRLFKSRPKPINFGKQLPKMRLIERCVESCQTLDQVKTCNQMILNLEADLFDQDDRDDLIRHWRNDMHAKIFHKEQAIAFELRQWRPAIGF